MLKIKDERDTIIKDVLSYTATVLRSLIVAEKTDDENEVLRILSKQCLAVSNMMGNLKDIEGKYECRRKSNSNVSVYWSRYRVFPNRNKKDSD